MITDDEEGGTPTATAIAGFGGDGQRWSGKKLATAGLHHISPPEDPRIGAPSTSNLLLRCLVTNGRSTGWWSGTVQPCRWPGAAARERVVRDLSLPSASISREKKTVLYINNTDGDELSYANH